ncbi:MAG: DUF5010 domain-containing protein [Sphingobacteriales bacterium]|nr:MAG: DUF5010 domain-containing protein [Sphingobacteriales bacterium]
MRRTLIVSALVAVTWFSACSKKSAKTPDDEQPKPDTPAKVDEGRYLGVTVGFQYSAQLTGPPTYPNMQNQSMYNPEIGRPDLTWESWTEQLGQSGVDFICPNLTGSTPNPNGSPVKIVAILNAIKKQGLESKIKFALFDDNAASWTAQWNMANGRGYGYPPAFDISDEANWRYIYDHNYKLFYETIPDANRFKINGRPVIIIWTGNPYFVDNGAGNISRALTYVRQKCKADFGFNPYIVLNGDFFDTDPSVASAGIADAKHNWFGPPSTSYTLGSWNKVNVGVVVPQFQNPSVPPQSYLNPDHGRLFENGLKGTAGRGALLTLCEGFTDYEEDAAMWRAANINGDGTERPYAQSGYDYPNQRINLLRKYSRDPFPAVFKLEAEGSDNFGGAAGGNGKANYYRNGNIAVYETNDAMGGHHVGSIQAGEWFEWLDLPFKDASAHIKLRVATSGADRCVHVEIDGVALPAKTLPATGGLQTWTTFDYGAITNPAKSYHKVKIVFENGGANFNWFQITGS